MTMATQGIGTTLTKHKTARETSHTLSDNVHNCTVLNGRVDVLKPSFQVPFCASLEPQLLIQTVGNYYQFAEDAVKLERHNLVRNKI